MVTAETITDEQIRELRSETARHDPDHEATTTYDAALMAPMGSLRRAQARARCAEILMARCHGRDHHGHAQVTCNGDCCASCGGPIDPDGECRCQSGGVGR